MFGNARLLVKMSCFSVGVLILAAVAFTSAQAGYKVPYEPYHVAYHHGGFAPGPSEYGKFGEFTKFHFHHNLG